LVDSGAGPNGTLLVATETNHVYGLDAVTGQVRWHRADLGPPWNPADLEQPCNDLLPSVGITSTPAIDSATHTAYMFSKTYASGTSGPAQYKAHAIDLGTGNEKPNFPVVIQGAADNDPTATFEATHHLQRPGLLLMNGAVYAAFGGHCDLPNYRGWVVGVSTAGAITSRWTDEALTPWADSPGGGIWHSGGRLVSDQPGQILLVSGNGVPPLAPAPGNTPPTTLGESVIRLQVTPSGPTQGKLHAVDFFSPCNALQLSAVDDDIGSGAPLALPDSFGTSSVPHLLMIVGKEGPIYLLDRDHLGGFQQGSPGSCPDGSGSSDDAVVDRFTLPNAPGVWATPAMWPGDGGSIYVPYPTFGNPGKLTSYRIADDGGQPTISLAGQSTDNFGYGTSSATITSDGTTSGSGLVWIVYLPDSSGVGAELRAYDANPVAGELQLRGAWPIGQGNKFTTPTVRNGRVYVGARDGNVRAFGVVNQSATQAPPSTPRSRATNADQAPDREG
jgi:outer membrane protein assembly factor BamB